MKHQLTYNVWQQMLYRCDSPKSANYKYYGGRGITVAWEWRSYTRFLADMGEKPKGLTLERIDNNKNYCKDNCKWATRQEQTINRRPQKTNESGITGVYWTPREQAYKVRVKQKNYGTFSTILDAVAARLRADRE